MCPLPRRYHGPLYGFFLFPCGGFEGSTFVPLAAGLLSGSSAVITFSIPLSSFFLPKVFEKNKINALIHPFFHPSFHPSIHPSIHPSWRSCVLFSVFSPTCLLYVSFFHVLCVCVAFCLLLCLFPLSPVVCACTRPCVGGPFFFLFFSSIFRSCVGGYFWAVWGAV